MRDKILKLLEKKGDIPPLPEVMVRLEAKIEDPDVDIEEIALIIETEPVLAGRLLKLSNSVFFGGGRDPVEDLASAILRLGLKMVLDLTFTLELPNLFKKVRIPNQRQFWQHSLAVAVFSRVFSQRFDEIKCEPDLCYISGLMHDIGIMVFSYLLPNEYSAFLRNNWSSNVPGHELEEKEFGVNHAELGALFIKKWWALRPEVAEAVGHHHSDLTRGGEISTVSKVVYIANYVANNFGFENKVLKRTDELFDDKHLLGYGINLEELEGIVAEIKADLETTSEILYK